MLLRMAHPLRTANSGTFFVTAITDNRRRLFQNDANARLFIETLQHYRAEGFYRLYAFVVMPDHVHLLITTDDLAGAMQRIKGGFSHRLGARIRSKFPVWQRGFADHLVLNREQFDSRREYIHQNPVRARLVERAEDYAHSSAARPVRVQ
jgi:putative transposase